MKRVAGVEAPFSLPGNESPPAHDIVDTTTVSGTDYDHPAVAFGKHFFKCFFCHIGDRYTEDHFCETGRELIVAMLDELDGRP